MVLKPLKIQKPMNELIAKELDSFTAPKIRAIKQPIHEAAKETDPVMLDFGTPDTARVDLGDDFLYRDNSPAPYTGVDPVLTVLEKPTKENNLLSKKNIIIGSVVLLVMVIALVVIFKSKKQ